MTSTAAQRIPPLDPAEFDEAQRKAAGVTKLGRDGRMQRHYATFMHNPYFLERWARMAGTVVLRSTLSSRDKMIVVMRLARVLRCSYAWVQRQAEKDPTVYMPDLHTKPQDHLSEAEIAVIATDTAAGSWTRHEQALISAVQDSFERGGISNATWEVLRETLSPPQAYDLVMLIGYYLMTMSMINSLGVQNLGDDPAAPWARIDNGSPA